MKLADHIGKAFKEWAMSADPEDVGDVVHFIKTESTPLDFLRRLSQQPKSEYRFPFRRGER